MTSPGAPLCIQCEAEPVRRATNRRHCRIIDGIRWRLTCSKVCAGRYANGLQSQAVKQQNALALVAFNRKSSRDAAIRRIRTAFGADFRSGMPITVQQAIALDRLARKNGWFARDAKLRASREYRALIGVP